MDKSSISFPGIKTIISFSLVMLLIGIFEEVLCRGIILNNMLSKWGYTKTGIIKAIVLSAFIFGLSHLVNLIIYPTLIITTLTQVMYTFLQGILYACIYLRCKNIWAVVILHAAYDWLGLASAIFCTSAASVTQPDISVLSGSITSILYIPFAIVGFFILRKVSLEDIHFSVITDDW